MPGPLTPYTELVHSGRLRADASQSEAVDVLQSLANHAQNGDSDGVAGVYLYGSVGSGKSMVMDLFASTCSVPCTRLHFHELMLDVHQQLHALHSARPRRVVLTKQGLPMYKYDDPIASVSADGEGTAASTDQADGSPAADAAAVAPSEPPPESAADVAADSDAVSRPRTFVPLEHVINELAARGRVLCLDEMQVTDVADAMLLRQLFEGLFHHGVRVVFTSNRPPEELYERGLNRKYFMPFVELLRERCEVLRVGAGGADALDYRTLGHVHPGGEQLGDGEPPSLLSTRPRGAFMHGPDADAQLMQRWAAEGASHACSSTEAAATIPVAFGRTLNVRARAGDACLFSFAELCSRGPAGPALGAADYLALASSVRCLYLSHVPVLSPTTRNEARRFVILVDTLYEARVRLVMSAEASLEGIVNSLVDGEARGGIVAEGAEVEVSVDDAPSFAEAPVGGRYRVDGELASFFTAKDERFMLKRTLSRLTEMTS